MEYFIVAESFAAPFCSDTSTSHITADTPAVALEAFAKAYRHPFGLFCANCYASADAYHKGQEPLAKWHSNRLAAELKATEGKSCYTKLGISAADFEIDGERIHVKKPKEGAVTPCPTQA